MRNKCLFALWGVRKPLQRSVIFSFFLKVWRKVRALIQNVLAPSKHALKVLLTQSVFAPSNYALKFPVGSDSESPRETPATLHLGRVTPKGSDLTALRVGVASSPNTVKRKKKFNSHAFLASRKLAGLVWFPSRRNCLWAAVSNFLKIR